jgi:predicted ATPase/class 3 adenylate cyclase
MAHQPSGTVTFLFTDIEGSTKLLAELGSQRYAEGLDAHRRLLRVAFENHEGYEVDCEGDAFIVAFQSAREALAAAAEAQRALADHSWPGGCDVRVRMGLHTGEPLLAPPKYVGLDIHKAARIMAAGHGGQVLISSSTAALAGVGGLRDLGEHRFKDLSAPERVYQLGDRKFPKLKSLHQTNLPVPATSFVGRAREVGEVVSLLARPDVRLLTLTGPGGTGKTRLAAQAAGMASDGYPDGVFWVSLAPVRDPTLVITTVAQTLEARGELEEHIGGKRMLLLLDNFEQVVAAATELADLHASCENLHVLVTSRERLQLQGEQIYPVPTLETTDGVELFVARARALQPSFEADSSVAELCARLEYLPLALELAAARTVVFSPEQLLERISQRLDLLKGARGADPRQQTLRAAIEWSYDLLTEDEQRLFRDLSIFAGGCTFEAAEEVCAADPDLLQSLLDKSLLRRRETEFGPRFWMLETIREYAMEKLGEAGDIRATRARRSQYFVDKAPIARKGLASASEEEWLAKLDLDRDNLLVTLSDLDADGNAPGVMQFVQYQSYLSVRGFEDRMFAATVRAVRAGEGDIALRARACRVAAQTGRNLGELDIALELAREGLELARQLSDTENLLWALNTAGLINLDLDALDDARRYVDEFIVIARTSTDPSIASAALLNSANLALNTGDWEVAAQASRDGLEYRTRDRSTSVGVHLNNLLFALVMQGNHTEAMDVAEEAFALHHRLNDGVGVAYTLEGAAGCIALQLPETARVLLGYATALAQARGFAYERFESSFQERTRALLARSLGDAGMAVENPVEPGVDEAVEAGRDAIRAARELDDLELSR